MSYEDLLKKQNTPQSAPKEEQRVDELSIPSKKTNASYNELAEKLAPADQEMLGMVKNYDNIKKAVATTKGADVDYLKADMLANQNLSSRNPKGMSDLNKKIETVKMPKKIS